MRVVEIITGTAGAYVLMGTVSRDDGGRFVAHARTYPLATGRPNNRLRSVAAPPASGPDIEVAAASAREARTLLCAEANARLGAAVTSFVWRPVLDVVRTQ